MVSKKMAKYSIPWSFDEIGISKVNAAFLVFFYEKTALITPALLTPALTNATPKNNANLGPALLAPLRYHQISAYL